MKIRCLAHRNGKTTETILAGDTPPETWNKASEWLSAAWATAHKEGSIHHVAFEFVAIPDEFIEDWMEIPQ